MYLKKYDLDKAIENIDKILNSFNDTWNEIETHIKTNSVDIYYNTGTNFGINISNKGIITDASRGNVQDSLATRVRINTPILDHLLLETQWIDPNVQLPKEGEWVILNLYRNPQTTYSPLIVETIFKLGCFIGEQTSMIKGWLPADNVVM